MTAQLLTVVFIVFAGVSLLSFLMSLTRYQHGLNWLLNSKRYTGLSRVFNGLSLLSLLLLVAVTGTADAVFESWFATAGLITVSAIGAGQLVKDGASITRNYPR